MNSYYAEWQSLNRGNVKVKSPEAETLHAADSRVSYASLGRKSREPLSRLVWDKNHSFSGEEPRVQTQYNSRSSTNFGEFGTSSGRQSSYELELLNRRLNILGDGFLDSGGDPWTPIEVVITPASSDLLGPEFSDDTSSEADFPTSPGRKSFISLRGLPKFNTELSSPNSAALKVSEKSTLELEKRDSTEFFLTANIEGIPYQNDQDNPYDTDSSSLSESEMTAKIEIPRLSPWDENEQKTEDITSHDKSTSPLQKEEDEGPMATTEIRIYSKTPQFKDTPRYPYETGTFSKARKLNRPTIHNGLLRSHRLHDFSQPSVVSSTQQLLCLTPSRGGIITLGSEEDLGKLVKPTESNQATVQVKRFNENDNSSTPLVTTVVTKAIRNHDNNATASYRLMQRDGSSRPRTSTAHGHPFALAHLHYRHTTQIRKPYRYPALSPTANIVRKTDGATSKTPTYERNATSMSMTKHPSSTAYRIIENHLKWNRRLPVFHSDEVANVYPYQPSFNVLHPMSQAKKMAPVLRVVPAFPRNTIKSQRTSQKAPKSPIDTEPASQKKVRFSDQIGLPLVRNATPNYRRKHSYILRWLETAGRPAKTIPLA